MATKAEVLKRIKRLHSLCTLEQIGRINGSLEINIHAPKDHVFMDLGLDTYVFPDLWEYDCMGDVYDLILRELSYEIGVCHKSECPDQYERSVLGEWVSLDEATE